MKINSLTLENFRQFYGQSTINFSTDPIKKATLIIADNGAGKTTIIESLHWCLYGNVKGFKDKEVLNKKLIDEAIEGSDISAQVILNFTHNNNDYELKRKIIKTKSTKQLRNAEMILKLNSKDEFGSTSIKSDEKEIKRFIDNILNESIFSYFFSKGEQIEELGKNLNISNNKDFTKAVKAILGLTYYENAIKNLNSISTEYSNLSKDKDTSLEYKRDVNNKQNNENRIEELKANIETLENSIEEITETIKKYNELQLSHASLKEKFKRRNNLQIEQENINNRNPEYVKRSTRLLTEDGFKLLTLRCKDKIEEILKSQKNIDTGIPGITEATFKHIFEHNKCLCGCDLTVNKEALAYLESLVEHYPPHSLGVTIEQYKKNLIDFTNNVHLYEEIDSEYKKYDFDANRLHIVKNDIKQINNEVKNHSDDEVKNIENRLREANSSLFNTKNQITSSEKEIERLEKENEQLEINIQNHNSSNEQATYYQNLSTFTSKIKDFIQQNLNMKEKNIIEQLKEEINRVFKSIFSTQYEIKIDNDYKISIESEDDSNLEYSTSQEVILAFCFIVSIMNVSYRQSKSKDDALGGDLDEKYPLIMDAPSSSFDKTRIKSFCKLLPECLDQFIILSKDTDGEELKDNLYEYIGKEYIFEKIDDVTTTIKEVSHGSIME